MHSRSPRALGCRADLSNAPDRPIHVLRHRCSSTVSRQLSDERLKIEIARVHHDNFGVYGIEKVWRQLNRERIKIGRDRVARLMHDLELSGVVRGKKKRTTIPAEVSPRPADLVERNFTAEAPNRLWVADLERHEALFNRAVMKGHRYATRRRGTVKLRAA
jgi:transposase InsO family protein